MRVFLAAPAYGLLVLSLLVAPACGAAKKRNIESRPVRLPARLVDESRTCGDIRDPSLVRSTPDPELRAGMWTDDRKRHVLVEAVVTVDGEVRDAKVVRSDDQRLDEWALTSVRKWIYTPGLCDDDPVEMRVTEDVAFYYK